MERNTTGSGIKRELPEDYKEVNKVELTGMIYKKPRYKEISPDKNGKERHMFSIMLKTKYLGVNFINMFSPKAEVTASKGFCEGDMVTVFGYLSNMKPREYGGEFKMMITATSIVPMTGVQSVVVEDLAADLKAEMDQNRVLSPEVLAPVASTDDEIKFESDELPF